MVSGRLAPGNRSSTVVHFTNLLRDEISRTFSSLLSQQMQTLVRKCSGFIQVLRIVCVLYASVLWMDEETGKLAAGR